MQRRPHRIGKVFADETRPWQQGARLTVWELQQDGIDATLIADSAASHLMKTGAVQWVVVGADRICANGDTANKIGTYQLAIAARHHGVKFMVVRRHRPCTWKPPTANYEIEERYAAKWLAVSACASGPRSSTLESGFRCQPGYLIDPSSPRRA